MKDQPEAKPQSLNLFDKARSRSIPVALYSPATGTSEANSKKSKLKVAIISHGYGLKNTDYSFIANSLVARGYLVASIQHELPSDEPIPTTGNPYETRKPFWERGVQNILFVIQELRKIRPDADYKHLLLIGHSNGGDMSMLFAREHPKLAYRVISLDNRRMPLPRARKPQILSIRSSDQAADIGVLPTQTEQERFGIKIVKLNDTAHNDMWDGATEKQKQEMINLISSLIEDQAPLGAQLAPDDCSWESAGSGSRKAVKLRTAVEGKGYTNYNQGKPISIEEWFTFTCGLDRLVPKEMPVEKPIEGAETVRVRLRGYLLGARFMRDGDHDIHVEVGASPDWNTDHVVVEMSAGAEYCAARKALWKLVRKDGCQEDQCVLRKPVEVLVTGYVLAGNPPKGVTDYCHAVRRGMRKGEQEGRVRGLWRLQPVLSVKKI